MIPIQTLFHVVGRRFPHLSKRHLRVLLAHHMGQSIEFLLSYPETGVSEQVEKKFLGDAEKLSQGIPLSRLLGNREFWGLEFTLSEETLDPRPDSETLIEAVLKYEKDRSKPLKILDLGTGTGCLLISLLREYPWAQGIAVDQSVDALETARQNAVRHGVDQRAQFHHGDWFRGVQGTFDLIISNPPYISNDEYEGLDSSVKNYDPEKALVAGEEGLDCYRIIIPQTPNFLKTGGLLVLEIGCSQGEQIQKLMESAGFKDIRIYQDLAGLDRCVVGLS